MTFRSAPYSYLAIFLSGATQSCALRASEVGPPASDGGADGAASQLAIRCDPSLEGTRSLAFGYSQGGGLDRHEIGSQVVSENGFEFIFINEACRYWVASRGLHGPLGETRSGTLNADELKAIDGALNIAGWKALVGVHSPTVRVFDGSPLRLSIPGHTIVCADSCFGDQPVKEIFIEVRKLLVDLFSKGKPLDGPVRIAVVPLDGSIVSWNAGPVAWPLSKPLSEFVSPYEALPPGKGHLIIGEEANVLRKLRGMQRMEAFAPLKDVASSIPIGVSRTDSLHALYLRDAMPIEDEAGLVPVLP